MDRKPVSDLMEPLRRRWPRPRPRGRRRILESTALLPGLLTIGNGRSGFAAIHFATKDALGQAALSNLVAAAYCIFLAMFFDMLDGRIARMTRRTTDFGGQLDSLCDVISFSVAPAMLMLRTVITVVRAHQVAPIAMVTHTVGMERVIWCIAGLFVACGVLRLARFNVENLPDESAHMNFQGLPVPGAAAPVAGLVLLFEHLTQIESGWRSQPWLLGAVAVALPMVSLAVGLLMVSRLRYTHLINQYLRGRRPFGYLVKIVIVGLAGMLDPYVTLAVVTIVYAFSGPGGAVWRWLRYRLRGKGASAGAV
ncbi:MAG: phosphatidylcholine/phosphatidylserine synthase [Phycisphaerae bacterium]|nr:phosphatidylcholine/phosphatidylserine synthase [Phycisphaerae bacterium]